MRTTIKKILRFDDSARFLEILIVFAIALLSPLTTLAQSPSTAPLIQSSNLSYIGSFKLPAGNLGSSWGFGDAGGGLGTYAFAFNPTSKSLYVGGHPYEQSIAEIAIPLSFSGTPNAAALQNLTDPLEGKIGSINPSDPNTKILAAALVYNGKLYLGAYSYYDGAVTQTRSFFVRPTNLATKGQVQGAFQVGNTYPGWVDKYATTIPPEWHSAFGGQAFVGGAGGAINAVQSWGPSVSVINPSDIGAREPVPASLVLGYPISNPLNPATVANIYWSQTDLVTGVIFPSGTRSVLFFGKHGMGAYCYGTGGRNGGDCYDPDDGSKGVHAYPYRSQIWAYDANDLLSVKSGAKQPWQIQPYAVWELDPSFQGIQGAAYDPATQRIYVSATWQDGDRPIIRAYQLNNVATPPPTASLPTVSLVANPSSVNSGNSSTLSWSATNVTACSAGGGWSGTKGLSGSESTGNLSASSTFSLTCTGAGGSATQSVTVAVTSAAPTVTISANPTSVASGSSSTISWSSTNANSCTASGAWSGTRATSGSQSTGNLIGTSTFTLACTGTGGSTTQSTSVTISSTPPPTSPTNVNVSTIAGLQSAITSLTSNTTILLADGAYNITAPLYLPQNITNVTIKGASGNREAVIIKGSGMTSSSAALAFWADNVNGITFQDMTIRDLYQHAIILNGGVNNPVFRNLHIVDIGDQFLKNNPTSDKLSGVDNGLLENSLLEYSTAAPDIYTNGLDVHRGSNWMVRNNTFKNFRTASGLAGPAVLIWNGSSDTTVARNIFLNNQRDIAFGLDPNNPALGSTDHARGLIANNFMYKINSIAPDVAIGVFDSPQTKVYHNTILLNGGYPNAIEYRFSRTTGVDIKNNLADASIAARDGSSGVVSNNLNSASTAMFMNPATGDLHLKSTATAAIDKGVTVSVSEDFDGQPRPQGIAADIGADEYSITATPPNAPTNLSLQ